MRYRSEPISVRAGTFTAHEKLLFLKREEGLTQEQMEARGLASSVRVAREILNRSHEPPDSRALEREYFLRADPPISMAWDRQIADLREMTDLALPQNDNEIGDSVAIARLKTIGTTMMAPQEVRQLVVTMRKLLRSDSRILSDDDLRHFIGKAYYAGSYYRIMARLADKRDSRGREWRETQRRAAILFSLVFQLLVASGKSHHPAGALLAFKANVNRMAMIWNLTVPVRRGSARMRRLVTSSMHFERLTAYAKEHNTDRAYALNALAIASRFLMKERYQELHMLLVRAASEYANPEQVKMSGCNTTLDDDFDDYIAWWKENNK